MRKACYHRGFNLFIPLVLFLLAADSASGQSIRGQVIDSLSGSPVGYGFVVALDSLDQELVRAPTSADGSFDLSLRGYAGALWLRSERIGYGAARLSVDAATREGILLRINALPVPLSEIVAVEESSCGNTDADERTAVVWEEVRKALTAASWSAQTGRYEFSSTVYERTWDARRRSVQSELHRPLLGQYRLPFVSRDPAELDRDGFVIQGATTEYFAPDAEVLMDSTFIRSHCFRIQRDSDRPGQVAVAFEPAPGRNVPDVRGAVWLDEDSGALQVVDFQYVNHPLEITDRRIGGAVEFLQTPTGAWIVHRWLIRAPLITETTSSRTERDWRRSASVDGFYDVGGEVLTIEDRDGSLIYEAEFAHIAGTVSATEESTTGAAREATIRVADTWFETTTEPDGSFQLAVPLEGEYVLTVIDPWLDSLGFSPPVTTVSLTRGDTLSIQLTPPTSSDIFAASCDRDARGAEHRMLVGQVIDGLTNLPVVDADVYAVWQTFEVNEGGIQVRTQQSRRTTDDTGRYAICGVPVGKHTVLFATNESSRSFDTNISFATDGVSIDRDHFPTTRRIWKHDLQLDRRAGSQIAGIIRDIASQEPVPNAAVALTGTDRVAMTDSTGLFILDDIEAGEYEVSVRRVGYAPRDGTVRVRAREPATIPSDILWLEEIVTELDPLIVEAEGGGPRRTLEDFWERRERGTGSFITRAEFEKQGNPVQPTHVLQRMAGVDIEANQDFVTSGVRWKVRMSRRGPRTLTQSSSSDFSCPPLYFLDRHYLGNADSFDIDQVLTLSTVQAVEAHGSAASMPAEFNRPGSACGVIVFWTR